MKLTPNDWTVIIAFALIACVIAWRETVGAWFARRKPEGLLP